MCEREREYVSAVAHALSVLNIYMYMYVCTYADLLYVYMNVCGCIHSSIGC